MRKRKILEKQEKQQAEILHLIMPIVDDGRYNDLTIREICETAGISTGMFYRHFRNKNDVLSFVYIDKLKDFLNDAERMTEGMSFKDKVIYLKTGASLLSSSFGPDGIMIYINNENEKCDCSVPRKMVDGKIAEFYEKDNPVLPKDKTLQNILDDITVLEKGILFEWYTNREEYDFEAETIRMTTEMVNSIFSKT